MIGAAGTVVYHLIGARLHGAVRIEPDVPDTAPLPSHLRIRLGTDPLTSSDQPAGGPVVDGVTVSGRGRAPLHAAAGWPTFVVYTTMPGPGGAWGYALLPHESERYLCGVLDALVAQYQTLDVDAFALAAARWRLRRLTQDTILPTPAPPHPHRHRLPDADPETYVTATDDGDWLTCTTCGTCTVLIEPGTTLLRLLQAHTEHRCPPPPPATTGQPNPRHT